MKSPGLKCPSTDKRLLGIDVNAETLFYGISLQDGKATLASKEISRSFGVDELKKVTRPVSRTGDLIPRS